MPLRVGVSTHFMLCMPSPITTSIACSRLLKTTTSRVLPVSVCRTVIFSLFMRPSLALDRLARRAGALRRAPQRPVDLGGEARERVEQSVAVEAVEHALALALGRDEAGVQQDRQVARHRRRAHAEAQRQVGGRERGLAEEGDDLPARHRRQGGEDPVQRINKHVNSLAKSKVLWLDASTRRKRWLKQNPARRFRWPTA